MDSIQVPNHVAIIMDGNGRWAKARGWPRFMGHQRGVDRVREVVRTASNSGVKFLTLYAFSEENWRRPVREVAFLMNLLNLFLERYLSELASENVKLQIIGNLEKLPASSQQILTKSRDRLSANTGMTLTLALSYSGRDEIAQAMRAIATKVKSGELDVSSIDESVIENHLATKYAPEPDLLIRTSGEQRLSNFLLWQLAYTEFYFTDVHWPDFDSAQLKQAFKSYTKRERRFGALNEASTPAEVNAGAENVDEVHA